MNYKTHDTSPMRTARVGEIRENANMNYSKIVVRNMEGNVPERLNYRLRLNIEYLQTYMF